MKLFRRLSDKEAKDKLTAQQLFAKEKLVAQELKADEQLTAQKLIAADKLIADEIISSKIIVAHLNVLHKQHTNTIITTVAVAITVIIIGAVVLWRTPKINKIDSIGEVVNSLNNNINTKFDQVFARFDAQDTLNKKLKDIADHIPNTLPIAKADIKGISTKYGELRKDSTGKVIEIHFGLDIRANAGTKVYAMASGIVKIAGYDDGWGDRIVANCQNGYEYSIAHMSILFVRKNEMVHKGQLIGLVGSTGKSTGDHADVRVYFNGKPVDVNLFILIG